LASNDALARFDGTTGKLIQNSAVSLNDIGDMTGLNILSSNFLKSNNIVNSTENFALELPNSADGYLTVFGTKYDGSQNGKVLSMNNNTITPIALTPADVVSSVFTSTNNTIALYDGTTGKVIKTSGVLCDASNNLTGINAITTTGLVNGFNITKNGVATNTLIGATAYTTSGANNVSLGNNTLTLTSGIDNCAIGVNSQKSNTTSSRNISIGSTSLEFLTSGTDNIAIGNSSIKNINNSVNLAI
jgi:hypothetical protein